MNPTQTPITGNEDIGDIQTPIQALAQFYYAFNRRDLIVMSQNWLQSPESAMDNPLGGIKRGWAEIKQVYRSIFEGAARVEVEFYDYTIHTSAEIFYAVGRERGTLRLSKDSKTSIKPLLSDADDEVFDGDVWTSVSDQSISDGECISLAIRTTRIFRHVNGVWRQVHHHGSMDDAELLERYQEAVHKRPNT